MSEHDLTSKLLRAVRDAEWGETADFRKEDRWSRDLVDLEMEKTCSEMDTKYRNYSEGGVWESDYSDWQKNYLVYKPYDVLHKNCYFCKNNIKGVVEDAIHILFAVVPEKAKEEVLDQYVKERKRFPHIDGEDLKSVWKTRTGLIKMAGFQYSSYWRYLVYWETFWGYQPYGEPSRFDQDISKWLCSRHVTGEIIGVDLYEQLIRFETQKWLRSNWKGAKQHRWKTAKEWVEEGIWAEGRAGDEGRGTYMVDGKRRRTGRTKGAMSQIMRDIEVVKDLFTAKHEQIRM